jgi:hypothetical protein
MTGHHGHLVAFHLCRQERFGLAGDDPFPERFCHPLYIVQIQSRLLGNLGIRQIQSHEIQT